MGSKKKYIKGLNRKPKEGVFNNRDELRLLILQREI
jgi:hypothetical protein